MKKQTRILLLPNRNVHASDIIFYNKCQCGAITIETAAGTYSCKASEFKKFFPNVDLRRCKAAKGPREWSCCNHCVNHYGLDLCSCGSGEKVGQCDCGSPEPMQKYGEYESVCAADSLLA